MTHRTKLDGGITAVTFCYGEDFVTEFHDAKDRIVDYRDADALWSSDGRVDQIALLSFHEAQVAMWNDEPHGGVLDAEPVPAEAEGE